MKTLGLKLVWLSFLMVGGIAAMAQDRQDVPGDDFSLEGALELFKKSASPEEFERKLNSSESRVNNLDLNGDGEIDYIRVIDRNEGNVHAFIMQAVLSNTESQDVAVIELEKLANGKAVLQITGDEDVYGIETIIEPTEEVRVNAGTSTARTVVNVWAWPSVQYVYSPYYEVWVSPWHWYYRPIWWYSWRPVTYYDYYSYWYPYRRYYSSCHTHRVAYARTIYRPYRTCSSGYYRRHETRIVHYRSTHQNDHSRYNGDRDRSRTSYTVDRTSRDRNVRFDRSERFDGNREREHSTVERTPVTRESGVTDRSNRSYEPNERERSTGNTPVQRERNQSVDRKPEKQREVAYTGRSEDRNKPVVERSSPRSERSTEVHTNKNSHREVKFEKPERGRSGGGEVNRSSGHGNGKGRGKN
jgi:hypothetical protein